jgi:phenylalanyl-tRNA synthetase beta chain
MGGLNSEISERTRRVLIESAYFNPVSIRKTAKRLGLNTDASHRFERGVDAHGTLYALDRAAGLMAELGGGSLIGGTIDVTCDLPAPAAIRLSVSATNRLLGIDLGAQDMAGLLASIDFEVDAVNDQQLNVKVPSYRVDVSRPEDLMEEIARRNGYERIPVTFPAMPPAARPAPGLFAQRQRLRTLFKGIGFAETITYSFIHKDSCDRLRLPPDDERRQVVKLLNPLTEEQSIMRTSLVPGLLETMQRNLAHQTRTQKIFEIGKIFIDRGLDKLPRETEIMAGLWTGDRHRGTWHTEPVACDFFDLKGAVEVLLAELRIEPVQYTRMPDAMCTYTRAGATARIIADNQEIGLVGAVHPQVLSAYDLKQDAFVFEIDLERLRRLAPQTLEARPIPKYPAVARDATLIVDRSIEAHSMVQHVYEMREQLVEQVQLIGVFEGRPIAENCKSLTLRVTYRCADKTLDDEMVNRIHKMIIDRLVVRFKAGLPV